MSTIDKIKDLKKQRDAVILAHYYVDDEVQKIADFVGDSFYLSKIAAAAEAKTILFCGVSFMGESAKILSPQKTVIMPDLGADCPMAHMADPAKIAQMRREYPDLAVVCYINSTAALKACSDVCVTSSNALKIIKALPNRDIYFIPDENLGRYVASKVPQKHFIFNDGFCHVHKEITAQDVRLGVLYELKRKNPRKRFYPAKNQQCCPDMKRITLEKVAEALEQMSNVVEMEEEIRLLAKKPLERMLELGQ